eukprot:1097987-Amphidinium_carterae.1
MYTKATTSTSSSPKTHQNPSGVSRKCLSTPLSINEVQCTQMRCILKRIGSTCNGPRELLHVPTLESWSHLEREHGDYEHKEHIHDEHGPIRIQVHLCNQQRMMHSPAQHAMVPTTFHDPKSKQLFTSMLLIGFTLQTSAGCCVCVRRGLTAANVTRTVTVPITHRVLPVACNFQVRRAQRDVGMASQILPHSLVA